MEGEWYAYSDIYVAAFGYIAMYRVCKSHSIFNAVPSVLSKLPRFVY